MTFISRLGVLVGAFISLFVPTSDLLLAQLVGSGIAPHEQTRRPAAHRARLLILSALAIALVVPGSVLADTPLGTAGGTGAAPQDGPIGQLLSIATGLVAMLAGLAVAVAVVGGIAHLVARIGGPIVAPISTGDAAEPRRSRAAVGATLSVLVVAGAAVVGVLVGRAAAFQSSAGGLGGAIGAGILISGLVVAVVCLVLIGLIATKIRHGHPSRAIGTTLAAAGFVAIGAFGGNATAAATGGVFHEPIVLTAPGQTRLALQAGAFPFVARDGGRADCRSVPDGQAVADVMALDLGELGSGTLRATLGLAAEPSNATRVELFIDGADLPEGSPQLSWSGPAQVGEISTGGASGTLTFSDLAGSDPAAKSQPGASASSSVLPGWPATISGSLSWTCQPWGTPLPGGVPPPPSVAP